MTQPKITRSCNECSECCKGQLTAKLYDRPMMPGMPCHFLSNKGCSIYKDRPKDPCVEYKCGWLQDDGTLYPEWLRPDLSKVIITQRSWGDRNQNVFLEVRESGQKIDSTVLNWVYLFAASGNYCLKVQVAGTWYENGPPEFQEFMSRQGPYI